MVRRRLKQGNSGALRKRPPTRVTPLGDVILQLRHVHSAVIVAVAALRRQNCELDEDIASLLQRCVCDRIGDQLEKLEALRRPSAARVRGV